MDARVQGMVRAHQFMDSLCTTQLVVTASLSNASTYSNDAGCDDAILNLKYSYLKTKIFQRSNSDNNDDDVL